MAESVAEWGLEGSEREVGSKRKLMKTEGLMLFRESGPAEAPAMGLWS